MRNITYTKGDIVKFRYNDIIVTGEVAIVDRYVFGKDKEKVTYDIYSKEENCLYKHINEADVLEKC